MNKKKIKSKVKKKVFKKFIIKKKIKLSPKKVLKTINEKELILKTRPEWVKSSLINKAQYQKK